jgi:hypothetical protein
MADALTIITEIKKIIEHYGRFDGPKWEGRSDAENQATAIFQMLRDKGIISLDEPKS